jgi:hypothetical protein
MATQNDPRKPNPMDIDSALAWLHNQGEALNFRLEGELEIVQDRPWSTVARIPSSIGPIFLKACGSDSQFEPMLVRHLAEWHSDCSPRVLAIDTQRSWLLMDEAGLRLRGMITRENAVDHWEPILKRYARLQIDLIGRIDALCEIGVPDRRLATVPESFAALLNDEQMLYIDQPGGLTRAEVELLHAFQPRLARMCSELDKLGIPATINHGDFHDANIFFKNDHYIFADWGDASLAHPFFSLRTVFVSLENSLEIEEDTPLQHRLRETYLSAWNQIASYETARRAFDLASCIWALSSLFGWYQSLRDSPLELRAPYLDAVPSLLKELLESSAGYSQE